MKRLAILLLLLCLPAFGTISVSGSLKDGSGAAVVGATVRFYARNCGANQPYVAGTALIAPNGGSTWYKDFTTDASGNVSGTLYSKSEVSCGGQTGVIYYGMQVIISGSSTIESKVDASQNINIDNPNLLTTAPVSVAPTGDTTYLRLDASNSPVLGAIQFNSTVAVIGAETVTGTTTRNGNASLNGSANTVKNASIQTPTFKGPNPWIDVTDPAYGAVCDGTTDDATAINAALAAAPTGGTVKLPVTGTCAIGSSITVPSQVTLSGRMGGTDETFGSAGGAVLKWTGATNGVMVKFHDVHHAKLDGVTLNGNNTSGIIAIQYDSDNAPSSSFNQFLNWEAINVHEGFVCGDSSGASATAQADAAVVENFLINGGTDTTAIGVYINSSNCMQQSRIERGLVQNVTTGMDIVRTNGNFEVKHFAGANAVGTSKTLIRIESTVNTPPILVENESEGNWTYALHDSGCDSTYHYPLHLFANQWNEPVLIDGCNNVISESGAGGGSGVAWTVGGTAAVISINENNTGNTGTPWTKTGSGKLASWNRDTNGAMSLLTDGIFGASFDGTTPTATSGNLLSRTGSATGAIYFGDGSCFNSMLAALSFSFNCGNGSNFNFSGTGTTIQLNGATSGNLKIQAPSVAGSNTVTIPAITKTLSATIASGTATMTTALIAAGACGTTVTVSASGTLTTDVVSASFNAAPGNNPGNLVLTSWPTVDNVNFQYCNPTSGGVTPNAATINWRVAR